MQIFSFDVTLSNHNLLKQGILAAKVDGSQHTHHRITVAADSFNDALLTAAQMGSCFGMVTGLSIRI